MNYVNYSLLVIRVSLKRVDIYSGVVSHVDVEEKRKEDFRRFRTDTLPTTYTTSKRSTSNIAR